MQGSSTPPTSSQVEAGRPLTHPSIPVRNNGRDNEFNDLIVCAHDVLYNENSNNNYLVIDNLGRGTFGQVFRCWSHNSHSFVAVKIIKNQPAYCQQAVIEAKILQSLNRGYDVDRHNIVRFLDCFPFKGHLCLVFELLKTNLFELLRAKNYSGLTINLVQHFVHQVLHALLILRQEHVIHGDLKPENILLKDGEGRVKIIDFGSSCMEHETMYSYIQSRFYRSPEVVLYYPYNSAIDMWSLGCIAAELALGLPLFSADSERDLLERMIEVLGPPPLRMLDMSRRLSRYFKRVENGFNSTGIAKIVGGIYQLLTEKEFEERSGEKGPTGKKYFGTLNLDEILCRFGVLIDAKTNQRDHSPLCFLDFLHGLLKMDPNERWNAEQASEHPFVTGKPFQGPYIPSTSSRESKRSSRPVGIGIPYQSDRLHSSTWHGQVEDPVSIAHKAAMMAVSHLTGSLTSNSPHVPPQGPFSAATSIPITGVSPDVASGGYSMDHGGGSSFKSPMNDAIYRAAFNAAVEAASNPSRSLNHQQQQQQQNARRDSETRQHGTMIIGFDVRNKESNQNPRTRPSTPSSTAMNTAQLTQSSPERNLQGFLGGRQQQPLTQHGLEMAHIVGNRQQQQQQEFSFNQRNHQVEGDFKTGLFEIPSSSTTTATTTEQSNQNSRKKTVMKRSFHGTESQGFETSPQSWSQSEMIPSGPDYLVHSTAMPINNNNINCGNTRRSQLSMQNLSGGTQTPGTLNSSFLRQPQQETYNPFQTQRRRQSAERRFDEEDIQRFNRSLRINGSGFHSNRTPGQSPNIQQGSLNYADDERIQDRSSCCPTSSQISLED